MRSVIVGVMALVCLVGCTPKTPNGLSVDRRAEAEAVAVVELVWIGFERQSESTPQPKPDNGFREPDPEPEPRSEEDRVMDEATAMAERTGQRVYVLVQQPASFVQTYQQLGIVVEIRRPTDRYPAQGVYRYRFSGGQLVRDDDRQSRYQSQPAIEEQYAIICEPGQGCRRVRVQ